MGGVCQLAFLFVSLVASTDGRPNYYASQGCWVPLDTGTQIMNSFITSDSACSVAITGLGSGNVFIPGETYAVEVTYGSGDSRMLMLGSRYCTK